MESSSHWMQVLGIGGQDKWPWEAIIIVGFGFFGFLTVSLPTVAITVSHNPNINTQIVA
jgi:hypothetical protein